MVVVGLFGAVRLRFPLFSQWGPLQVSRVGVIQSNNMVVAPTRVAWRGGWDLVRCSSGRVQRRSRRTIRSPASGRSM